MNIRLCATEAQNIFALFIHQKNEQYISLRTIHKPTQTNKSFLPMEGNFALTHIV